MCCVSAEKRKSDLIFTQDPEMMNFFNERVGAASYRHIRKRPFVVLFFLIPSFSVPAAASRTFVTFVTDMSMEKCDAFNGLY